MRAVGTGKGRQFAAAGVLVAILGSCSPSANRPARGAAAAAGEAGKVAAGEEGWAGRVVGGLPPGSDLWDVAVGDSGAFVAVGTVSSDDTTVPLVVWRSGNGRSWHEVFRYPSDLGFDSSYVGVARGAVAAQRQGFAIVSSHCADSCVPFALYSPDGTDWRETDVPVRPPSAGGALPARSGRMEPASFVEKGVVLASPEYTIRGAEMLDVVATPTRLVAVGWTEVGRNTTASAVWLSDDGGRTWRQAPEGAVPHPDPYRDQLDRVTLVRDRLVAGGGNRCCYDQSVGEVWTSDDAGETWRPVRFPEKPVSITGIAATGAAAHVVGSVDWDTGGERVQWRLTADDRWERLPATPTGGRLLAGPEGLLVVDSVPTVVSEQRRLVVFHTPDGTQFHLSRASGPREALDLDLALVSADHLLAYVTAGEGDDRRRFLFEAPAGGARVPNSKAVWAARVRPSPVLFGGGVRVPAEDGRFVDVTPPQKTSADLVVDAFFLDSNKGWALLADSETQSRRLVRTTDAGSHWEPGGFGPSPETGRWLFFADRDKGWIVAYSGADTYPKPSLLFRTSDGGATWTGPSPLPACGPVQFGLL